MIGTGTYNKERKAATLRQSVAERERFRGIGLRIPIGNKLAAASAMLSWGLCPMGNCQKIRSRSATAIRGREIPTMLSPRMGKWLGVEINSRMEWAGFCGDPGEIWNFPDSAMGWGACLID